MAINEVINTRSSVSQPAVPNVPCAKEAQVSAAASVETTVGNGRRLARASAANSWQASTTSSSAISRNSQGGAYHTAATATAISAAPLMMRVITSRRAQWPAV
jgi:hypothetical protein